jgi:hypothetical protein
MYDWVRALLDPTDIVQSPSSAKKQITPPPKFEIPEDEPEMSQRRRGRSASPSKQSPRKSRTTRVGKDVMGTPSTNAANASLHSALEITASGMDTETVPELAPVQGETQVKSTGSPEKKPRSRKTKSASTAEPEEEVKEEEKETKEKKKEEKKAEKKAEKKTEKKIEKKNEVKDKEEKAVPSVEVDAPEGVKTTQTTVSLDMPISLPEVPSAAETEAMIAQAKGMVEDAIKAQAGGATESESVKVIKKRKPEEDDEETSAESTQRAKKAKVLENKLREERVRNRSIFGVSVAFALA